MPGRAEARDEQAIPFDSLVQLEQPRRGIDLPDLSSHLPPVLAMELAFTAVRISVSPGPARP